MINVYEVRKSLRKKHFKMSQKNNREGNQVENKLNLDFLGRDEKFWQEKLERLAKSSVLSISNEKVQCSDVSK